MVAGAPIWLISIFFRLSLTCAWVAGLYFPYAMGTGLSFLRDAWNAAIQEETLPIGGQLSWTAVVRVVGLSVSLGFGLIGGTIIPTVVVGFCMGLALLYRLAVCHCRLLFHVAWRLVPSPFSGTCYCSDCN
jgi:H+/Cl- antiporter ClcA